MIDWIAILQAGIASGTVLLFAAIGEIMAERSGVMNLGVEGMMLIGAMTAYRTAVTIDQPWVGLLFAMLAAGILSLLHAVVSIHFQADQVVSGLAINFVGIGLSMVLGEGLSKAGAVSLLPTITVPLLSQIPVLGPILFTNHNPMTYLGYALTPAAWFYIHRTRPGLHLRAVGEHPAAADAMGINVYRLRYGYVFAGGVLAGLAGGTISLAVSPGWFSELTTSGQGWIAIGLVIFAQWNPWRAAAGAYMFGALRRLILDLQGPQTLLGFANPFFYTPRLGFFLQMLPYALVILILFIGSREAMKKRVGAPAALGVPYIRGERGT
ncbi:MAG: ABC transporter permease [Anaerolineae bacterium]|nr:ABC transporter permease [Thermoflexales bacterium]MDW8406374.1 ABC transporter permease [Anaerolineae bacterium]